MNALAIGSIALLFLYCAGEGRAQSASDLLSTQMAFQNAVTPIYSAGNRTLLAIVRVEKTRTEYERRGFFRIGALPVAVLEGVRFEIRETDLLTSTLERLHQWLAPRESNRLELRRVIVSSPTFGRIEAGRARVAPDGKWELSDGVLCVQGTNQIQAARAILQASGAEAGKIVFHTTPPTTNHFLTTPQLAKLTQNP